MASGVGTATLNFGSVPGTNLVTVAVTGQTGISTGSGAEAYFMGDSTGTHNDIEHLINDIQLTCSVPTAGVGFTIYALSTARYTGTFQVRWVWSD